MRLHKSAPEDLIGLISRDICPYAIYGPDGRIAVVEQNSGRLLLALYKRRGNAEKTFQNSGNPKGFVVRRR